MKMFNFVDNNSDKMLLKSLKDKAGLVQVQRTVQGQHGSYTRRQWVKASDIQDSDKVISQVNKDPKELKGRNAHEDGNDKARLNSLRFRRGLVVSTTVDTQDGPKKVTGEIISTKLNESDTDYKDIQKLGLQVTIRNGHGQEFTKIVNGKDDIKTLSKEAAEKKLGKKFFSKTYYLKTNPKVSFTEKEIMESYRKNSVSNKTFDDYIKEHCFVSDGYSTTDKGYRDEHGNYTKERQQLHNDIIKSYVDKADDPPKGEAPTCYLFGGGSASGKSSVVNPIMSKIAESLGVHFESVDSDAIKEKIPEYDAFKNQNTETAAFRVHDESSEVANMTVDELIKSGKCFAFDGTMKNEKKYNALIDKLKQNGYKIKIIGVDIPTEDALRRADARAAHTGRKVPHGIIKGAHGGFATTFPKIMDRVDDYFLYDNSQERGKPPTLIRSRDGVHDEKLWDRFVKKGEDYVASKNKK